MKKNYLERVRDGIVIFDGAMGTELYSNGIQISTCFEEVCLKDPALVEKIHRSYIAAGAHVIETNSFGANPIKLKSYQIDEKTDAINRAAARIAKAAAGDDIYVAGSVGPLGVRIAPMGKVSRAEAVEAFEAQIRPLVEEGVDLLVFETFRDMEELSLAVEAAVNISSEIPVQAQVALGPLNQEEYGREALDAANLLCADDRIDVIGFNCAVGPEHMLDILLAIRGKVNKPVAVMPNAGLPRKIEDRNLYLASPAYFGNYALRFFEAGAAVIGGCCGTTPEHIKKAAHMTVSFSGGITKGKIEQIKEETEKKEELPLAQRSLLGKAISEKEWITTVEMTPPMGCDLTKITEKIRQAREKGLVYFNFPDGPRASSRLSVTITALEVMKQTGAEVIPHICCRDKNLIGLQAELLGIHAAGMRNVLVITGDPPKVGNYPDVTGVFDVDAVGLITLAKRLNCGVDLGGNPLPSPTSLVVGAGVNPVAAVPEREIDRAFLKQQAGADFFITQPVFDAGYLIEFLGKIKDTGLPVLAGLWPLVSYRNAMFLNNEVPGVTIPESILRRMEKAEGISKEAAKAEGVMIAREILAEIRPYISGVQISPPFGNIQAALDVVSDL